MSAGEKTAINVLNEAQWPWIAKAGHARWNVTTSGAPRTFNICSVNTDRENQETIARLIAAAPDLAEALKWIAEDGASDARAVECARAALSKAGVRYDRQDLQR